MPHPEPKACGAHSQNNNAIRPSIINVIVKSGKWHHLKPLIEF